MKRLVTKKLLPKLIKLKKVIHVHSVKERKLFQKIISMMACLNYRYHVLVVMQVASMMKGFKEIVEGIDVQTWLTGKVSDVVTESLNLEAVADIPIFNRIRELNKQEMMAIYQFLSKIIKNEVFDMNGINKKSASALFLYGRRRFALDELNVVE